MTRIFLTCSCKHVRVNMCEYVLYFDDVGVTCKKSRMCRRCSRWKPTHTMIKNECRVCYDRRWMEKNDQRALEPLEISISRAVTRANRRSRYRRSVGADLTVKEAAKVWNVQAGMCANCKIAMTFRWHPRHRVRNSAILDRVDTSQNRSYAGNFQWMCADCNTEKGGFDLSAQKDAYIQRLRRRIRKMKRQQKHRRCIHYNDVLMR